MNAAITHTTDAGIVVNFDDRHEPTRIPIGYLEAGALDHAYAMTIHKAQGLTRDRVFVLGDGLLHRLLAQETFASTGVGLCCERALDV